MKNSCGINGARPESGDFRVIQTENSGDTDVIDTLIDLLHRARRGEINSIAAVAICNNGDIIKGYANAHHDIFRLIGGLESLKIKMTDKFVED